MSFERHPNWYHQLIWYISTRHVAGSEFPVRLDAYGNAGAIYQSAGVDMGAALRSMSRYSGKSVSELAELVRYE